MEVATSIFRWLNQGEVIMFWSKEFLFAVLIGLFAIAGQSSAELFHVNQQATGASDTNNGLSAELKSGNQGPWLTIQHAVYNSGPGDTIVVHEGDYRNEVTGWGGAGYIGINNSGTASNPIRFLAEAGDNVLVNRFRIQNASWVEIDGFNLTSSEFELPANWLPMPNVIVDDPSVVIDTSIPWPQREPFVRQKYATYMAMQDFFLTEFTTGCDVLNSTNITIRNNTISLYTFGVQVRGNSEQITIEQNKISNCLDGIFTWDPPPSICDSIIRGNTIRQCFNNGMQVRQQAENVLIEDNDVRYSGTAHISILNQSSNCTVKNNRAIFGGYYTETMMFPGSSAINIHTSNEGIVVDGNLAAYQNDITGGDGNGFIIDLMLTDDGVLLKNNVAWRNMGSGIRTVASPNCVIVNNTLAENGYLAVNLRGGSGVYLANQDDLQTTVVNNIFLNNDSAGIKSFFTINDQTLIDHNLYFGDSPLIWDGFNFGHLEYHSIAEIQTALGHETNGLNTNPNVRFAFAPFIRSSFPNLRLRRISSAIDAGMNLSIVNEDFENTPRPIGKATDIGAFEFSQ